MTRSGIEHNLSKSPYISTVRYGDGKCVIFYFSSQTGKDKFDRNRESHRAELRDSLTARFKMMMHISAAFSDVDFYRRIEGRGFYVHCNGHEMQFPSAFSASVEL